MNTLLKSVLPFALAVIASGAVAQEKVVNVYNWSDYVGEGVLEAFTKETGIKVVYDTYDSMETMEAKLSAGSSGYDVVVPTDRNMERLIQAGILQPLDRSKLPNAVHQWDLIKNLLAAYDPGNQYAENYMWGTTGIGYNVEKIKAAMPDAPLDSWAMIFDPAVVSKFKDCGIHLLDSPDDMLAAAMNYLGLDPNSKKREDLEKGGELLKTIAPNIQKFHSSEYINALANGDICLAVGYSGDVIQARDRAAEAGNGVTVGYSIPKEGALIWFDSMVVLKDAPHPEEAHAFIDYMMRPEVAAANSNFVFYPNGNKASQPLLTKDVIDDPTIYPPEATLNNLYSTTTNDQATQRIVTRIWSGIKSGG